MRIERTPCRGPAADTRTRRLLDRRHLLRSCVAAAELAVVAIAFGTARADDDDHDHGQARWAGTWGASPQQPATLFGTAPSFSNQTVRQIVRISVGGTRFRVRLSNEYGAQPLVIGAAHIAISAGGSAINAGTDRVLTFGGQPSVVVPVSAPVFSDPVELRAPDLAHLAISLYLPQTTGPATWHFEGKETAYIVLGDSTAAPSL